MGHSPETSSRAIFREYINKCRIRNNFWGLTYEQFMEITAKNCTYCDRPPSNNYRNFKYNGIDRINPKQGYHLKNCAPCCFECNQIKSNRFSTDEMKAIAQALKDFRASRNRSERRKRVSVKVV